LHWQHNMDNKLKVMDHPNLYRDTYSKGIVDTNKNAYIQAMDAKLKRETEKQKMNSLCDEINNLKEDMGEIKELLKNLIRKQ